MTLQLRTETRSAFLASLRRFFDEHLERELTELQAVLLYDFLMVELAPSVYNRAVADAEATMTERVADLSAVCYEPELGFWEDRDP